MARVKMKERPRQGERERERASEQERSEMGEKLQSLMEERPVEMEDGLIKNTVQSFESALPSVPASH